MSVPTNTADETAATEEQDSDDTALRVRGRAFLLALYKAMRSITLYPIGNTQVTESLDELTSTASEILEADDGLEVRVSYELFYVNNTRLRMDVENFASFGQVLRSWSQAGIGLLRVDDDPGSWEWKSFVSELVRFEQTADGADRAVEFQRLIESLGVKHITGRSTFGGGH